ncbi:MAG: Zn-ribbon domain-containing OB-fold protein [Proteobacteria bacterium]|nr:Zn-ribbon domain-containing OB-fold protein [Pseudomonadota bacterium]
MTVELGNTGTRIYPNRIRLRYNWWLGSVMGRFYRDLKEKKRIWGNTCPDCGLVYVPPKENCPTCFTKMNEFVEVGDTGNLLTYTIVRYKVPFVQPLEPPFALGIIQLDGADTGLTHLLGEVDLDDIEVGMRLKAVFRDEPQGNLLDIKYFRPL